MIRLFLFLCGHIFVLLGVLGIFLPLLPTTPFLLLAAFCYGKASEKFHKWLLTHPRLGPPIENWRKSGSIDRKSKTFATVFILISLVLPYLVPTTPIFARILSSCILAIVLTFIWTRPEPDTH